VTLPIRHSLFAAVISLAMAVPASAGNLVAFDTFTDELLDFDTDGSISLIGIVTGHPSQLSQIDVGRDGTLYATLSLPGTGYQIWTIDANSLTSTLLHNVATTCNGDRGIAIDPTNTTAWITGTVGTFPYTDVRLQEVDLATGTMTDRGSIPSAAGWVWGLAFELDGRLFAGNDNGSGLTELLELDLTNAANSTNHGLLTDPTVTQGGNKVSFPCELMSARGGYGTHIYSFQTGTMRSLDTSTVTAPRIADKLNGQYFPATSAIDGCAGFTGTYGAGCAGSGGFIPQLSVTGCGAVSEVLDVKIENGLGGANALVFVGNNSASIPAGKCTLLITPFNFLAVLPLGGIGPGAGSFEFSGSVPVTAAGTTNTVQTWVEDPAIGIGAAGSNAAFIIAAP